MICSFVCQRQIITSYNLLELIWMTITCLDLIVIKMRKRCLNRSKLLMNYFLLASHEVRKGDWMTFGEIRPEGLILRNHSRDYIPKKLFNAKNITNYKLTCYNCQITALQQDFNVYRSPTCIWKCVLPSLVLSAWRVFIFQRKQEMLSSIIVLYTLKS